MKGGLPPSRPARTPTSRLVALGFVAATLVVGMQPAASACPLTDVDCVVGEVEEVVDGLPDSTEEVGETVEDVTSDPGKAVEDVVTGTADKVNETAEDTFAPPSLPATGDPGVEVPPSSSRVPEATGRGRNASPRQAGPSASSRGPSPRLVAGQIRAGAPDPVAAPSEIPEPVPPIARDESGSRDLTEAARRFAFPLLLSALVAAYLFFQGRVDKRDPKLVFAPMDTDMLLFE